MLSLDSLPSLALFARIVQLGSFSAVARQYGLHRSAISKRLRALEESLGMRLLQRSTRKLTLTEAGEKILEDANLVLEALERLSNITDSHFKHPSGGLKVSCSSGIGRMHLVPLMTEFHKRYPDIEVQLMLEDRIVDMITERVDVAIRVGNLQDSSFVARRLGQMSWMVCASPDYLRKHGTPKQPSELKDHDCLYYQNRTHAMNHWSFGRADTEEEVRVKGPLSLNDSTALIQAAEDGLGILCIDRNVLKNSILSGSLVPVLQEYALPGGFPIYAIYPTRKYLPLKTQVFVEFLLEVLSPRMASEIETKDQA